MRTILLAKSPGILDGVFAVVACTVFLALFAFAVFRTAVVIQTRWGRKTVVRLLPLYLTAWGALFSGLWYLLIEYLWI